MCSWMAGMLNGVLVPLLVVRHAEYRTAVSFSIGQIKIVIDVQSFGECRWRQSLCPLDGESTGTPGKHFTVIMIILIFYY